MMKLVLRFLGVGFWRKPPNSVRPARGPRLGDGHAAGVVDRLRTGNTYPLS